MTELVSNPPLRPVTPLPREREMREAARALEATFLHEMLRAAGAGKPRDAFGGGAGEEHFSSFLLQTQAEQMAQRGGIGLAESLFQAMKGKADVSR